MLLHIGALPPYECIPSTPVSASPIASLLTPFDCLALLISAIGHDVGHPGVNNVFLIKLNAPLAQLYNDNSVLEAFHCAAFSQILRRYWPAAFKDTRMRKLLISSILATDMGVHFKFIERMAELQKKYRESGNVSDWSAQDQENYRTLLCGLLIKCADISNVVSTCGLRNFDRVKTDVFSRAPGKSLNGGPTSCKRSLLGKGKWRRRSAWRRHSLAGHPSWETCSSLRPAKLVS